MNNNQPINARTLNDMRPFSHALGLGFVPLATVCVHRRAAEKGFLLSGRTQAHGKRAIPYMGPHCTNIGLPTLGSEPRSLVEGLHKTQVQWVMTKPASNRINRSSRDLKPGRVKDMRSSGWCGKANAYHPWGNYCLEAAT